MAGVSDGRVLEQLRATLEGLAGAPGAAIKELRVVLRCAPPAGAEGGARTEVALLRNIAEAGGGSWCAPAQHKECADAEPVRTPGRACLPHVACNSR